MTYILVGISYVTRLDSGECHPRKISSEEGSDINHNEDGTISMTSPFEYWNYDNLSFASNGIVSCFSGLFVKGVIEKISTFNRLLVRWARNWCWILCVWLNPGESRWRNPIQPNSNLCLNHRSLSDWRRLRAWVQRSHQNWELSHGGRKTTPFKTFPSKPRSA